ncbi:lycopene cyclase domain-containing protein [Geofilum rubicundum]|uniref:Lycopene cyclase n=1 Tax=Geofilum rubicundum JCM 15548 TaxID=1236989 RepID=A0A0E9LW50_9BACT|nr:lycopene cyclase domain-containing protein [Geofilum rubicundum]GAO29528.1 lycopene cyclase [Geofilum rubicundum JCM 15548]
MPLYTAILVFSILIPFVLSFDRKVSFYKKWKSLLPSTILVGAVYIYFDVLFVRDGVWGFNPEYHSELVIFGLPIEEWLFFMLIPYASIFIHYVLEAYFPNFRISNSAVKMLSWPIILILVAIVALNIDKAYTRFNYILLVLAIIWGLFDKTGILNRYYLSFLVIMIPFFLVNSLLTGTMIEGEVVWYNNAENLGIRWGTIPIEDVGYAFSLMLLNLLAMSQFEKLYKPQKN